MPSRKHWLDVSARMFQQLIPPEAGEPALPNGRSGLSNDAAARVDEALAAMALATGPQQLSALIATLERSTLAALHWRWTRCAAQWNAIARDPAPDLFPWMPAQKPDVWRAVLIAMIESDALAKHARRMLWPDRFEPT